VARGVAYVPGAAFYAGTADAATLRLSFVTASASEIDQAIATLATLIQEQSP
jgi:2-aminoadipate transaminase